MKNYFSTVALSLLVLIASCKKDEVPVINSIEGDWFIYSFIDNGIDNTNQYSSYTFTFDNMGNMTVNGGGMMNMCDATMMGDSMYHFDMMGMHGGALNGMDGDWMMMNLTDSTCTFTDDEPDRNCTFIIHRR